MSLPNPTTWEQLNLGVRSQQQVFIQQLVQYLMSLSGSVATLNNQLGANDLGTLSSNPTINCSGFSRIYIGCVIGGANRSFTLTNLGLGVDFALYVVNASTHTITVTASDPSSNPYTVLAYQGFGSAANKVNMTTAGWANAVVATDALFLGKTMLAAGTEYLVLEAMGG